MPLKSWAWSHGHHNIRAEIWWRYSGWSRRRLYVDHDLVIERRGYFLSARPLRAEIHNNTGADDQVEVSFSRAFLLNSMKCHVLMNGLPWKCEDGPVDIEKRWTHLESHDGLGPSGLSSDNPLVGCFFLLLLMIYGIIFFPIAVLFSGIVQVLQNRRLKSRLRQQGRFLAWREAEKKLNQGPSTLIFQLGWMREPRIWWVDEDVLARSPFSPPNPHKFWTPDSGDHPFVVWCYYHYLMEETGKGILTEHPPAHREKLFRDPHGGFRCPAKFPLLRVVVTGYVRHDYLKSVKKFMEILERSPDDCPARFAAAIESDDRPLRCMAVDALRMIGGRREEAIPILTERLYHGPWSERHDVASTLATVGGISILQEASNRDDPSIKWPSSSALDDLKRQLRKGDAQNQLESLG
jgi:hypothetical protein